MDERMYWLGFSVFPGIGPVRFALLLKRFGDAKTAWYALNSDLTDLIGGAMAEKFVSFREGFPFSAYEKQLQQANVYFVPLIDRNYPKLLAQIKNPPIVLYVKGEFDFNSSENLITVAIVGSRKVTDYGTQATQLLTRELTAAGCVIVSGLAVGVDRVAHATSIEAGGKTIAVLGCGVDCCTPRENEYLYDRILQNNGAIISEFALGSPPTKGSFPSRNRVIAGMSQGVIVTEGAEDSGALITAKFAFANNRKVFAVPGPITSNLSKGPYELIKKGAVLVATAGEVLDVLDMKGYSRQAGIVGNKATKCHIQGATKEEQVIIDLLENESMHFNELVKRTGIDAREIGGILSLLEMKGIIQGVNSGIFSLTYE